MHVTTPRAHQGQEPPAPVLGSLSLGSHWRQEGVDAAGASCIDGIYLPCGRALKTYGDFLRTPILKVAIDSPAHKLCFHKN